MTKEETKQHFRDTAKIEIERPKHIPGGQSCGMPTYPTVLTCDELDVRISLGVERQNHKNREHLIKLFDLLLDILIK